MTGAILKMNAHVQVTEGMRVYYDCPMPTGEDRQRDQFYKTHHGKIAVVTGFSEKLVGPLDADGRLPGVYINPDYIDVQFEGEEEIHKGLNLQHFILYDAGRTVIVDGTLRAQKVRDLPKPIKFWPGDRVVKIRDTSRVIRTIEDVHIEDDGTLTYVLAETMEAKRQREAGREADLMSRRNAVRESGDPMAGLQHGRGRSHLPQIEYSRGKTLSLVSRGNVYHLYHDPAQLVFALSSQEISFWAQDGISELHFEDLQYSWSLKDARDMIKRGRGDLIVESQYRTGDFRVRRLHTCFAQHRSRVRELSLQLRKPPVENEVPFSREMRFFAGRD